MKQKLIFILRLVCRPSANKQNIIGKSTESPPNEIRHNKLISNIPIRKFQFQLIPAIKELSMSNKFVKIDFGARIRPMFCSILWQGRATSKYSATAHSFYRFLSKANNRPNKKIRGMENITKIWTGPLPADSPYVKPYRFYYVQNGVEKNWDLLKVHDSVSIIIFHKARKTLIFVKQFRPAVFHSTVINELGPNKEVDLKKFPPKIGVTIELCAGIVDKEKSLIEIAHEEISEECGYNVPLERIEEVLTFRSGVGSQGSIQTMYFCAVTDSDKISSGGGVDGEIIEVVELSIDDARDMVKQGSNNNCPPSCLLGIMWFLTNKLNDYL